MKKLLTIAASMFALTATAFAADLAPEAVPVLAPADWFLKLGASYVAPDSNGTLAGVNTVTAGTALTGTVEAGRFLTNRISVSLTAGFPPTQAIIVNGVDTGKTVTLGAVSLGGQFHLINNDQFDLYAGGGVAYNVYFSSTNPAITSIDNGFAPVLQIGAEYKATKNLGLFVDVKKEFYTTKINYTPAFLSFQERLDPLVVTAGVAIHF